MSDSRYRETGLLLLRLGIGLMFMAHGWPKLIGGAQVWESAGQAMSVVGINFAPAFWGFMAGFSEFFGGIALITGLFLRPFCVLLSLEMAVAATMHLSKGQGWTVASHAIELGILFLSLLLIGPGNLVLCIKCSKVK